MITEDYCSYEVAKLLKEKGFKGICDYAYSNKGNYFEIDRSNFDEVYCLRPTLQMAMKWLREVHGLYIVFFHTNKSGWWYNITDMRDSYVFYSSEKITCSYEEAVDLAIKYILENLI